MADVVRENILGVPANLDELLRSGFEFDGYQLVKVYCLLPSLSFAGFSGLIFKPRESGQANRYVMVTDLALLERVWRSLPPRGMKIVGFTAYVNEARGIFYRDTNRISERVSCLPERLLGWSEFLSIESEKPFVWLAAAKDGKKYTESEFFAEMVRLAKEYEPWFETAFPE